MIIPDKQMKHLPKGQLPGRNPIQKRQTTYFSFLGEPAEKDFIYFFFFLSPFRKIAAAQSAAFFMSPLFIFSQ